MNMFEFVWCSKNYFRVRSMFKPITTLFLPYGPTDILQSSSSNYIHVCVTSECKTVIKSYYIWSSFFKAIVLPRARNQQFIFSQAYIAQDFIKRSQYCRKCYVKQKGLSKVGVTWYSNTWCMKLIWLRITFCLYVLRASLVSDLLARIGVS